jgi:hypothetical protein
MPKKGCFWPFLGRFWPFLAKKREKEAFLGQNRGVFGGFYLVLPEMGVK